MAVGSNVNPNFPIPGIDQDSRGFRDNFATIKQEIENIQSKTIQLVGGVVSDGPVIIDSSNDPIVINTTVLFTNVGISGNNYSLIYNDSGILACSDIYFDSGNAYVGINTPLPRGNLDLPSNIFIGNSTISNKSGNLHVVSPQFVNLGGGGNVFLYLDSQGQVGIGKNPEVTLDVQGGNYDVARFTSTLDNTDVGVRFKTSQSNASVGWIVENTNNYAGGLRLGRNGEISLHVGESPASGLQDGSQALTILPTSGYVGIGNTTPTSKLYVQGNVVITGNLTVGGQPSITGSRGGVAALASLLTAFAARGLIVDNTSA
jgi:hypothetical protein